MLRTILSAAALIFTAFGLGALVAPRQAYVVITRLPGDDGRNNTVRVFDNYEAANEAYAAARTCGQTTELWARRVKSCG